MADRPAHVQAEMDGMRAVPDTGAEPWATRLKPPHPVHVARAAGALITVTESLTQAYMVAYTLHDAGLLAAPAPLTDDQHWQWRASMIADLSGMNDVIGDLPDARAYFEAIADGLLKVGWRFGGAFPAAPAVQPIITWHPSDGPTEEITPGDLCLIGGKEGTFQVASPAAPADDEAAIERMAYAMWQGGIFDPARHQLDDWRDAARAALAALREGQ